MSTPAQIAANQANARHSTGPRTAEGKTASAANSTQHGFYSTQAVLLTDLEHSHFEVLRNCYVQVFQPADIVEVTLLDMLVLAAWNLERANQLETELANSEGIDPILSETNAKTLDRIIAYRMRSERTFHKCHKELRALKAGQKSKPAAKPIQRNEPNFLTQYKKTYVRPEPKVGRNDACPCKSGRKYKLCCLRNEANPHQIGTLAA